MYGIINFVPNDSLGRGFCRMGSNTGLFFWSSASEPDTAHLELYQVYPHGLWGSEETKHAVLVNIYFHYESCNNYNKCRRDFSVKLWKQLNPLPIFRLVNLVITVVFNFLWYSSRTEECNFSPVRSADSWWLEHLCWSQWTDLQQNFQNWEIQWVNNEAFLAQICFRKAQNIQNQ